VRPYKDAWPVEDAVAYLEQHAGTRFDAKLVSLFLENIDQILAIKEQYFDQRTP
jgi:putative two-component system response regulator